MDEGTPLTEGSNQILTGFITFPCIAQYSSYSINGMVCLNIDGGLKDVIFIPEYHSNIHFVNMLVFLVSFLSLMSSKNKSQAIGVVPTW